MEHWRSMLQRGPVSEPFASTPGAGEARSAMDAATEVVRAENWTVRFSTQGLPVGAKDRVVPAQAWRGSTLRDAA